MPAPTLPGSDLTAKQEKFCQVYVKNGMESISGAYKESYDVENCKDETIYPNASRLAADSRIIARVTELNEKVNGTLKIDKSFIQAKLLSYVNKLEKYLDSNPQLTNQVTDNLRKQVVSLAEVTGLLIDKSVNVNIDANDLTENKQELAKRLAFLLSDSSVINTTQSSLLPAISTHSIVE